MSLNMRILYVRIHVKTLNTFEPNSNSKCVFYYISRTMLIERFSSLFYVALLALHAFVRFFVCGVGLPVP